MSSGVEYEKIGEIIERVVRAEGLDLVGWALKGEGARSMLRIVIDRDICNGQPVIEGTRVTARISSSKTTAPVSAERSE